MKTISLGLFLLVFLVLGCSFDMGKSKEEYEFADEESEEDGGQVGCEVGARKCLGNEIWRCNADGMWEKQEDCKAYGAKCVVNEGVVRCIQEE